MDPNIANVSSIHSPSSTRGSVSFQTPRPNSPRKQSPSILEWFDKSVEKELRKQREDTYARPVSVESRGMQNTLVADASTSAIDITRMVENQQNTDLLEAVEKLAKAQAVDEFEGAVRAAERAAEGALPENAEEAAAAGVRGFQAELTSVVQETIPGLKPIEVVGYVGITRPKGPKRS